MALSASQKRHLRGLTHHLKPLVTVAGKGLSETVTAEIERALNDHELIKVKLRGDRETRKVWADSIADQCKAELLHTIGQVACYYRKNPDNPAINPG